MSVAPTVDVAGERAPGVEPRARAKTAGRRATEQRLRNLGIRAVSLAVFLGAWQWLGQRVDPVLFTTPAAVGSAAWGMFTSGELWFYLWPSLVVLAAGLALAIVFGVATGLLLARVPVLDTALDMYITFLYSIPSVALVPLIVLWAGFETSAKIIILFLFAYFPVVINTYQGVKNVDARLIEVGRAFRCSERQLWGHIVLPAALPFIVTGIRLAVGRGLIGMVLADLYTAISGIGYLIVRSASTYRVDKMFVPVVVLGLLGIALTALLRLTERRLAPWTVTRHE
jgi:NitT/TauT family transport system permease protein